MSAPAGNKYAVGNKGGGRKSAFQEQADANFFADLWNGRLSKEKLRRKILIGKYGAKHILALKILEGDERLLGKLLDRFFPIPNVQNPIAGTTLTRDDLDSYNQRLNDLIEQTKRETSLFEEPPISEAEEQQIIKAVENFGLLKNAHNDTVSETLNR